MSLNLFYFPFSFPVIPLLLFVRYGWASLELSLVEVVLSLVRKT